MLVSKIVRASKQLQRFDQSVVVSMIKQGDITEADLSLTSEILMGNAVQFLILTIGTHYEHTMMHGWCHPSELIFIQYRCFRKHTWQSLEK